MQILPTDRTALEKRICRKDFSVHTSSGDNSLTPAIMKIAFSTRKSQPFSTCTCECNCSLIPLQHCEHAYPLPCMSHQVHHTVPSFVQSLFDIHKKPCTTKNCLRGEPRQCGYATPKIETNACFSPRSLHPHSTSANLPQAASLALRLEEHKNVPLTHRPLDVAHD